MWLIFVLSTVVFFVAMLGVVILANKACNKIIKDNRALCEEERKEAKNE